MYKDTLKDSSTDAYKSFEELWVEVEQQRDEFSKEEQDMEVSRSSSWAKVAAMKEEMNSLRKNKTWELVDHLAGQKLVRPRLRLSLPSLYLKGVRHEGSQETKKILGMEIVRDRSRKILRVSQSGYVSMILNNFRIQNEKSVKMPFGGHFKLSIKDSSVRDYVVERTSKVSYTNTVGSLMYLLVCTRLDITYAVSVVSRYLANLDKNHREAVKWILKYLWGTTKKATLQHLVALSTIEAKYMALTEAVNEAIWLRGLLEELGVELNTVVVNCDNQGAIHISWNHVFLEKTKHINVRYHFIREVLEAKTVKVLNVGTGHNVVDALTNVVKVLSWKFLCLVFNLEKVQGSQVLCFHRLTCVPSTAHVF
nr:retrovirus-related Pol polyprotein from transposon TNT 1-94 [Tanacetum cinerariifolium]